jgi:hypothetical protein
VSISLCVLHWDVLQVAGSAGKVLVSGLSKVDSWLEGKGLLGQLQPAEVPAAVRGEDGDLNEECREVRGRYSINDCACGAVQCTGGVAAIWQVERGVGDCGTYHWLCWLLWCSFCVLLLCVNAVAVLLFS